MAKVNPSFSIKTFNVSSINSPVKRPRLAVWIYKGKTRSMCGCLQETYFRYIDIKRLKVKEWKRCFILIVTKKELR